MTHTSHTIARRRLLGALLAGAVLAGGAACSLDVTNPNAATEDDVLTTPAGMRALTVGMQGRLGNAIHILAVQAVVYHAQGDSDQAFTTLERALQMAEPEGFIRPLWTRERQ